MKILTAFVFILTCLSSCRLPYSFKGNYDSVDYWYTSYSRSDFTEPELKPGTAYIEEERLPYTLKSTYLYFFIEQFRSKNGVDIFISDKVIDGWYSGFSKNQYKLYHLGNLPNQFDFYSLLNNLNEHLLIPVKRNSDSIINYTPLPSKFYGVLTQEVLDNIELIWFNYDTSAKLSSFSFDTTILRSEFPNNLIFPQKKFLFLFHNQRTENCNLSTPLTEENKFTLLNPEAVNYAPERVWNIFRSNYTCFIYEEKKQVKNTRRSAYNIRKSYEKFIQQSLEEEDDYLKAYFEIVLWLLYQPTDFKLYINDGKGETASFIFTSNNSEYPGKYEVKFNIYQPYYFKVFKR